MRRCAGDGYTRHRKAATKAAKPHAGGLRARSFDPCRARGGDVRLSARERRGVALSGHHNDPPPEGMIPSRKSLERVSRQSVPQGRWIEPRSVLVCMLSGQCERREPCTSHYRTTLSYTCTNARTLSVSYTLRTRTLRL